MLVAVAVFYCRGSGIMSARTPEPPSSVGATHCVQHHARGVIIVGIRWKMPHFNTMPLSWHFTVVTHPPLHSSATA